MSPGGRERAPFGLSRSRSPESPAHEHHVARDRSGRARCQFQSAVDLKDLEN